MANFYLTGAHELRHGSVGTPTTAASPDMIGALTVSQLFDAVALRVNGPACWDAHITLDWNLTDDGIVHRTELRNGVLVHYDLSGDGNAPADATFTLAHPVLIGVLLGGADVGGAIASGAIQVEGDASRLAELAGYLDAPDPNFAIVTP